jgi:hypothetical protein
LRENFVEEERRRRPWMKFFGTLDETSYIIIGSHISMGPWMRDLGM